jgi:hypothetical protein
MSRQSGTHKSSRSASAVALRSERPAPGRPWRLRQARIAAHQFLELGQPTEDHWAVLEIAAQSSQHNLEAFDGPKYPNIRVDPS